MNPRPNAFIKLSSNLLERDDALEWLHGLQRDYYLAILVGGGTQITTALEKAGLHIGNFGDFGRELETFEQRQVARNALEINEIQLQEKLQSRDITANTVIPCLPIGKVLCHVNGDWFLRMVVHGYHKIFVATLDDRFGQKQEAFADLIKYGKLEIKTFPI